MTEDDPTLLDRLHAERLDLLATMVQELRAGLEKVKGAARAYHQVSTFPQWHSGECRLCMYDLEQSKHQPVCEFGQAEQALLAVLGEDASK